MKKRYLSFLLLPLLLTGCKTSTPDTSSEDSGSYSTHQIVNPRKTGEIAAFDLTGPVSGHSADSGFVFTWQAASNADYYQIEFASTNTFIKDSENHVYVKESNLSNNTYTLNYSLPKKDILYYWRVTAINKDHTKESTSTWNFFYKSALVGELPIQIEDAQDWVLHKEGSYADISVDRNNFFGNNQNSLAIVFDKEHTCQGIAKSDGWIVVTKSEDRELYGTDSFYFNFYYSGHDATVLVRVLDYDGEYWHKKIQISNNSKQTILLRYDEFELRTAGTNIFNREFDWQHIRYFEIVFERTFGDGICLFSNIKAVKYDDYKDMFIQKLNFKSTNSDEWTYETYEFDKTISEDGSELTLGFTAKNAETNPNGFPGWGYQNVNVYKYLVSGDAIRLKVKYTNVVSSATFYFRILEEDNDRWQFKTPFSTLKANDYTELIVPLKAMQRMEYMNGDGAKQFYFIQKFNFGLANNYSTGTLSIKDVEVIKIDDIVSNRSRVVGEDGCVDDFNDYNMYTEMYYYWDQSVENKDESMKLDNIHKTGGNNNTNCAEFDYKADMEMAVYQLYMDAKACTSKTALSLWIKDASPVSEDPAVSYIPYEDVAAEMTIQLTLDSGEWYRYIIPKLGKEWQNYTLAFDDMRELDDRGNVTHNGWFVENERELIDDPQPITSEHIVHMAFGFKYLFYDQQGNHHPTYAIANPVYIDEIYFTTATATSIEEISGTINPDTNNPNQTTLDTFENYANDYDVFNYWSYGVEREYNEMALDPDVSSQGGVNSLRMHYKGYDSVSYGRVTPLATTVLAKGLTIDIKGDGKATVYVNLNWRSGNTLYKMRYTVSNIPTSWTRYELGFSLFEDINGSTKTITMNNAKNIESVSFGIVNGNYSASDIYVDNIRLLNTLDYEDNRVTAL